MPSYGACAPLHWREFDGQWVVYQGNPPSLTELDAFGAAVLFLVEEGPVTPAEVALGLVNLTGEACAATAPQTVDGALVERVADLLRGLALDGFVEPWPA